jgi:undecaprenyl diphosphate synthase
MSILSTLNKDNIPSHVAIIMDGNGRWAKQHGKMRIWGHTSGVSSVRQIVEAAGEAGVRYLTLYAFSTENWNRPKAEIDALMTLLVSTINKEIKSLQKNNVRLITIGDTESLPQKVQKELSGAISKTCGNNGLTLNLALSYSSRSEIIQAVKSIAKKVAEGKVNPDEINEQLLTEHLYTRDIPEPELLIRTSGEYRLSNFLLWQIVYTELYFTETLWPDFGKEDFFAAIADYQKRERRFGKTSEQININKP